MRDYLHGTIHFHSTYSHDGKNTLGEIASNLSERGFSFCVMTEHFEDFDTAKFDRYVQEVNAVTENSGFLLIPGVEVDLSGLHTIVFPVREYAEVVRLASDGNDNQHRMFKVLAHPSKYPFEVVLKHLRRYAIEGVELWNQEADGHYLPPFGFLELLKTHPMRNQYRYFFGCDVHNVNLMVTNVISVPTPTLRTTEAIVDTLINGDFLSRNVHTGIEYCNGSARTDFDAWLAALLKKSYYRGKLLRSVRFFLKSFYTMLPRDVQHSLNDLKNYVRNKV